MVENSGGFDEKWTLYTDSTEADDRNLRRTRISPRFTFNFSSRTYQLFTSILFYLQTITGAGPSDRTSNIAEKVFR